MRMSTLFLSSPFHSLSPTPSPPRRTFSDTIMEETIENAESIVRKWDLDRTSPPSNFRSLFSEKNNSPEALEFIGAITDLRSAMHCFVKEEGSSHEMLSRANDLLGIGMKRLEKEFHSMLKASRNFLDEGTCPDQPGFSYFDKENPNSILVSEREKAADFAVMNLQMIADCMISCGHGKECAYIYNLVRKSFLDESLYSLGVEKLSSSQIHKMDWDSLEVTAKNWLNAVKVAVKTIFHGEKILCDTIFASSDYIRNSCFTEIVKNSALTLFCFPENLAKCKKFLSPERIFRFLDLYDTVSELRTEIEIIFISDSLSAVRSQAVTSLLKLGEAVRAMLSQFESLIEKDPSKTAVPGGDVHPLTRYVMNYLVFLADYGASVDDVIADWPVAASAPLPESFFPSSVPAVEHESPGSAISVRLAWVILLLLCKLDSKAVLYRDDVALSYLFLANNLNYVVSKVRGSKLNPIMGPHWIFQQESKVKQFVSSYKKMGWARVTTAFPDDPTAEIGLAEMKECFQQFNAGFREAYRVQSSWVIPDPKLRDEVKISLSKAIVPVYRVVYEKYEEVLKRYIELEPIVRYAPDDLENYLSDLFYGNGGVAGASTASSTSTSPPSSRRRDC